MPPHVPVVYPKVRVDEKNPEPVEIIAKHIAQISEAMAKINAGPLKQRAVVLLVSELSGVGRGNVTDVLNALADLKRAYLK